MNAWLRVRAIAKAWPTWLVVVAGVATVAADEFAKALGADAPAAVLAVRVASWLGAAVAIIRRSTPVLAEARGVLPTGGPLTEGERLLGNEVVHLHRVIKEGG